MTPFKKLLQQVSNRPFHPIALALYPVLFLYSQNTDQTPLETVTGPLLLALLAVPLLWVGPYLLCKRDLFKSSLWASLLTVLFFVYGHIHSALHLFALNTGIHFGGAQHAELLLKAKLHAGLIVLLALALILLWRKVRHVPATSFEKLSGIVNTMSAILLLMPVMGIAMSLLSPDTPEAEGHTKASAQLAESGLVKTLGYQPDIYHIVLDGYAREDVLNEFYNYDNSPFLNTLKAQGFTVVPQARSNYTWTFLSFASFLNMDYVNDTFKHLGPEDRTRSQAYLMARDNKVMHFLRDQGYRYVHLKSAWGATMMNMFADEEIPCTDSLFNVEFYRVLMESTFLKIWESPVGVSVADCHLTNLKTLEQLGSAPGPKVVVTHFVPPHHPYLFDREGTILRNATVSNQFEFQKRLWGVKPKYIDQLVYFNKRMETIVDQLVATSPNPPIIIIHSDHGPQLLDDDSDHFLHGRFSNLIAMQLPGVQPGEIPEDLTLVNMYRKVFNLYFDSGFEMLENRYYQSAYYQPYDFEEVLFDAESPRGRSLEPQSTTTQSTQ